MRGRLCVMQLYVQFDRVARRAVHNWSCRNLGFAQMIQEGTLFAADVGFRYSRLACEDTYSSHSMNYSQFQETKRDPLAVLDVHPVLSTRSWRSGKVVQRCRGRFGVHGTERV
jgi:hypothetical protein